MATTGIPARSDRQLIEALLRAAADAPDPKTAAMLGRQAEQLERRSTHTFLPDLTVDIDLEVVL